MRSDAEIIDAVNGAFSQVARPEHFTNHLHCAECEEHDRMLLRHDRTSLRVEDVNNPASDPLCFCSPQGMAYYMPALVKFALDEPGSGSLDYWQQLLFHLEGDGPDNALVSFCTKAQRKAIAAFLEHLVETRAAEIESCGSDHELFRTHGYWASEA